MYIISNFIFTFLIFTQTEINRSANLIYMQFLGNFCRDEILQKTKHVAALTILEQIHKNPERK